MPTQLAAILIIHKIDLIVGYKKIVVSSKPTAASFTFGQKHKHISRFDTDGPGPSAYDITGLSVKGIFWNENDDTFCHVKKKDHFQMKKKWKFYGRFLSFA